MRLLTSYAISGLIWLTSVARGASHRFDFGPEKSAVFQNFTPVSSTVRYTKDRGYGFIAGGDQDTARNVADDLGRDFVMCDGATFVVDAEPGNHEVWVLLGDYGEGINPPPFWFTPYAISANGQQVVSVKQDWHNFFDDYVFRNYKTDWQPGQSLWDKYMAKFDRAHQFEVASDSQIKIAFSGPCPLRAMVIYSAAEKTAFEKCIAETNAQRKKQFDGAWTYTPFTETNPAPKPSPTDRGRGFMLFRRYYMEEVRPESLPRSDEINAPLTLFAARGEYEPVSFCLYPLTDLKQVQVTVDAPIMATPKRGTHNQKDGLSFDLRLAKYSEFDDGLGKYHVGEHILLPARPLDIPHGLTRRWWLTFHLPENQPGGAYRGRVTVRAAGRKPTELPLVVKVLPFTLREPSVWMGPYYYTAYSTTHRPFRAAPGDEVDQSVMKVIEQDFRNLREHGMNMAAMDPEWGLIDYPQGKPPTCNEEVWKRQDGIWRLYREILPGPLPAYSIGYVTMLGIPKAPSAEDEKSWQPGQDFPKAFKETYAEAVKTFYERAHAGQARGDWPEIIYYASDELSNYGSRGGEWGKRHLELLREIKKQVPGGFRVCASMNGRPEAPMLPLLDIAIPNGSFPITGQTLEDTRNAGCEQWFYNIGFDRFTWGFFLAKTGARGRLQWHYRTHYQGTPDFFNTLTGGIGYGIPLGPDGPCQVGWFEMTREGIDDLRYVRTLQEMIDQARGRSDAAKAVAAGEKTLNWILDNIHDLSHYWHEAGTWDNDVYDKLRWQMAQDIMGIQKAIGLE